MERIKKAKLLKLNFDKEIKEIQIKEFEKASIDPSQRKFQDN